MRETIVIGGALAQKPGQGGHTWVFLQYLLGFKRLGWDVLFLDQLEPEMCIDATGQPCTPEKSANLRYFRDVMQNFGLSDAYALICERGQRFIGLSRQQVLERVRSAAFLLNIMGFIQDEEILARASRRVFLDIDPGFGHMWRDLGLADVFQGHDDYVTIAENIGGADCEIPSCGLPWTTTRQPVVLECWPVQKGPGNGRLTSVATWRGAYAPVEYRGSTYGLRVHEFRKFAPLPLLDRHRYELALNIHPAERKDLALLRANGWSLVDPHAVAGDPWAYQTYIQSSEAEFAVAKNMYVNTNSGWFSDRSICYLASGRPVVAQDTGLATHLPTSAGLLTFTTLDEALCAVEELASNYDVHARAARALAEDCFDSDKVLSHLLSKLAMS